MSKITKDVTKKESNTSLLAKKRSSTVSSKPATSKTESGTDKKTVKTTKESTQKNKTSSSLTSIKEGHVSSSSNRREEIKKNEKPLKSSSLTAINKTTEEVKKIKNPKTSSSKSNKLPLNTATSPSTRITKTQYFPSKNLYSNALKTKILEGSTNEKLNEQAGTTTTTTTHRKTIPSSEKPVKVVKSTPILKNTITRKKDQPKKSHKNESSPDTSSVSERPRTATLRKGSIVNENIVGPDAPKHSSSKSKVVPSVTEKSPSPSSDDYQYDDDFESYESDFEQYSSTSNSTNTGSISAEADDTTSNSSSIEDRANTNNHVIDHNFIESKHAEPSSQIRVSSAEDERKLDSGNFDLPDFRQKQMLQHIKQSIEKENSTLEQRHNPASLSDEGFEDQKSLQFINFAEAKKKFEHRKSLELKKKRGEEILNMIRLDSYSFTLFELPPVPYEVFIRTYGKSNTVQTSIQTGDDDVNEETQTETIEYRLKWTQCPTQFINIDENVPDFWETYKNNFLGVGTDGIFERSSNIEDSNSTSNHHLDKSLLRIGNLVIDILREETIKNTENLHKTNIVFSDGYHIFNTTSSDILTNCSIRNVAVFSRNFNKILSVHVKNDQSYGVKSVICCWDISDFENAEYCFMSYDEINCCCFTMESCDIVVGGQKNGIISVWNVKESRKSYDIFSKTVSYSTKISQGHNAEVVSIHSFPNNERDDNMLFTENGKSSSELCSLDEYGKLIFWNLFKYPDDRSKHRINITLVEIAIVDLKMVHPELNGLRCTNSTFNTLNPNYMYISTNYGFILHHLENGVRSNVKKFLSESKTDATCLETCPFSPNYFLAGFNDGSIGVYSRLIEVPLMVLTNTDSLETSGVQVVQWSKNKPFVMYAKDSSNNIHVWDLSKSDMYPVYTIPFGGENITCMKLSPMVKSHENESCEQKSYMVIGTESGNIYWHLLNSEHGPQSLASYQGHVDTFLNYVNRL